MRLSWETAPPPEFRENALQGLLSYALEVYKENARVATVLEDKAQKTAGIAGVFLGAGVALTRGNSTHSLSAPTGTYCLIFAVGCLVVSIVFSLLVMRVKSRVTLIPFDSLVELIEDIVGQASSELRFETRMHLRRDQIRTWEQIIVAQQNSNEEKALLLLRAQALLMLAVLASAISTTMALWNSL
jgi:hypothetical protein